LAETKVYICRNCGATLNAIEKPTFRCIRCGHADWIPKTLQDAWKKEDTERFLRETERKGLI